MLTSVETCLKIDSRKLVGEQAHNITAISDVHELKSVHDSLKHRRLVRNMGPLTARPPHGKC